MHNSDRQTSRSVWTAASLLPLFRAAQRSKASASPHLSLKPLMLDIRELLNDSLLQKFLGP
jgi:hypothetical protein